MNRPTIEEQVYRTVGEASQDFMFIINRQGIVEYVNSYGAAMFNRRPEDLIGQPRERLFPPEIARRQAEALAKVFESGQPLATEGPVAFPGGRTLWIHNKLVPVKDDSGFVWAVFGVSRDITERKQSEESLRESEATIRALMDARTDIILILDTDFRVIGANRSAAERFGKTPEEMIGVCPYDLFGPEVAKTGITKSREVLRTGRAVRFEDPRAGTWFDSVVYPVLDPKGKVFRLVTISRDITDRKRTEDEIRHYNERLENMVQERTAQIVELERQRAEMEKFAATGRLAARIAHEINNPLAGIKNSFLLVKSAVPANHPYHEYIRRIEKEVDRISRIVHQMFGLYRPEHEGPVEFRMDEMIDDVISLLGPVAREYQVVLKTDSSAPVQRVRLPENLLRQVAFNLIHNAIEASPPGAVVRVVTETDTDTLTLRVSDQGKGIPEALQSRIFEPFFTTKTDSRSGGLGLGLSISKNVVEVMKGTLTFQTRPGQGTTFRVDIPLAARIE